MPKTIQRPARDRAWRRAQRARVLKTRQARFAVDPMVDVRRVGQLAKTNPTQPDGAEKKWGQLYTRKVKTKRAQQLQYLWPWPKKQLDALLEDME